MAKAQRSDGRPARWRLVLGFAVLPPIQSLVVYLAFEQLWQFFGHSLARPVNTDQTALAMALVTGLFGVVVTICAAVPVVLWLIRTKRASFQAILIAGAVLGNTPLAFYVLAFVLPATVVQLRLGTMSEHLFSMTELMVRTLRVVGLGTALGVISAALFWLVALSDSRRGEPAAP